MALQSSRVRTLVLHVEQRMQRAITNVHNGSSLCVGATIAKLPLSTFYRECMKAKKPAPRRVPSRTFLTLHEESLVVALAT